MNSLEELNGFGQQNNRIYDDDRPISATFSGTGNAVIWANTSSSITNYPITPTRNIVSAQSINANSTFTISNVASTGNVNWVSPLPTGISSSKPDATTYRVTGPLFPNIYDQVKTPILTLPANFSNNFTMTSNISLGANTSRTWVTDVRYPFPTGSEWSGVQGNLVTNAADSFNITFTAAGSTNDPVTSNAQINLGNLGNAFITSQTITNDPVTGNVTINVQGGFQTQLQVDNSIIPSNVLAETARFDSSDPGLSQYGLLSTINTQITLNTTQGRVIQGNNIPLKVTVDGIRRVFNVMGLGGGGPNTRLIHWNLYVPSSGQSSKWPLELSVLYPYLANSGQVWRLWVVNGHFTGNEAAFNSIPIGVGSLPGRVLLMDTNASPVYRTVRIDTAFANHANFTWPSQDRILPITVVLQQFGGLTWPNPFFPEQRAAFTFRKTAVPNDNLLGQIIVTRGFL